MKIPFGIAIVVAVQLASASLMPRQTSAQSLKSSDALELSGVAYLDYAYVLSDPGDAAGDNGFGYRRIYLTSDYKVAADMKLRARLEAGDTSTNEDGKPAPFMKDLYLQWDNALAEGHRLTIGISSPPSFTVAEGFLGYRSLDKMIQDRDKIVSSRDMGVKMSGPLGGALKYAVMFANNSGTKAESNRHKRVYGQIEASPTERVHMTIGADYASLPGGSSMNTNAFIGYSLDKVRFGVEGYYNPVKPEDNTSDMDRLGVSVFGAATVSDAVELVARYDNTSVEDATGETTDGWFGLLGLAWQARDNVRFIPNVILDNKLGADEARVTGRVTLHVDF
ncbi:MAG: hypothetical protein ACI80V_000190 [Rhodothermales bacterium]|jgi:hypothetical protein